MSMAARRDDARANKARTESEVTCEHGRTVQPGQDRPMLTNVCVDQHGGIDHVKSWLLQTKPRQRYHIAAWFDSKCNTVETHGKTGI